MYNSLRRLLLLTIASTTVLAPAVAQALSPGSPPAPVIVVLPRPAMLAMLPPQTGTPNQEQEAAQEDASNAYDAEKRKTIDKTFKVSRADMLNIDNKHGKVHINTWDKNEMHVKVDIIARASTDARAQEILNNIKVTESREDNTISFRTNIAPMRISGNNNNRGFEVNYTISMPKENAVTVKQKFGDVYLATLQGKADINIEHGSFRCDVLGNTGNIVKLAYASGACNFINGGSMDISYADMRVGEANNLHGTSSYTDFKVGSLGEVMEMDVRYGSFKVDNISRNIQKIALDSGFTPISLNFSPNTNFNFDVSVQFADFNYDKSLVNLTSLEKGHTSAEYKGEFGGASPKGLVSINSKYGEVRFTK